MPLSRTYASLDLVLDIGLNDCSKHSGPTNSLPPTFQPGVQLNVQQSSPAEPVEPSPPLAVSLPTNIDPGPRQSLHPAHPVISCSKPKQDLYRQVLISYLKKTAKGRVFHRGTRKSALTTVNSRKELKWMMATHMPKKMSIFPTKQSAA